MLSIFYLFTFEWIVVLIYVFFVLSSVFIIQKLFSISISKETQPLLDENKEKKEYFKTLEGGSDIEKKLSLMKRAVACIKDFWSINEKKSSLEKLVYVGLIDEEDILTLKKTEEYLINEMNQIKIEANTLKEGWEKKIFNDATQIANIETNKEELLKIERKEEKRKLKEKEKEERKRRELFILLTKNNKK